MSDGDYLHFVVGFVLAVGIMMILIFATAGQRIVKSDYCSSGFGKPQLVLYEDHTWACTDGQHEQMVK